MHVPGQLGLIDPLKSAVISCNLFFIQSLVVMTPMIKSIATEVKPRSRPILYTDGTTNEELYEQMLQPVQTTGNLYLKSFNETLYKELVKPPSRSLTQMGLLKNEELYELMLQPVQTAGNLYLNRIMKRCIKNQRIAKGTYRLHILQMITSCKETYGDMSVDEEHANHNVDNNIV